MLNYETILSSYDDKLTLMQWLKKVEDALGNASAVAFNVTKTGNATLTFSLEFEDGSKIESGPIVLQQGESVESAAITNGHLYLTLTNGDVLDAGNIFNGDLSLSGNLSVSGTLSAPILTTAGNEISTQKPVVEVMNGYSFTAIPLVNATCEVKYAGVVKNGNKLTLAVFVKITKSASTVSLNEFLRFTIPADVASKIYPFNWGASVNVVDIKSLYLANENGTASYTKAGAVYKTGNELRISFFNFNDIPANEAVYARYEVTFLLSDSLAA